MEVKEIVGPLRGNDGELVTEYAGMSKLLNNYFSSVFTKEDLNEELPEVTVRLQGEDCCMLWDIKLSKEIIEQKRMKLSDGKAPGIDGIVPKVLIECAKILNAPLLKLFLKSLKEGLVPKDWKRANISAIFKKGTKESPGNYRPVSLTSNVCKIF